MNFLKRFFRHLTATVLLVLFALVFMLVVFWDRMIVTIQPGYGGVAWSLFFDGTRFDAGRLGEGVHISLPWNRIYVYNLQLQSHDQSYEVATHDGLQLVINISYRWHLIRDSLPLLNRDYGPNYPETLMIPAIGSITREVIAKYNAQDLLSQKRSIIQNEIYDRVTDSSIPNGVGPDTTQEADNVVALKDILIKDVILPDALKAAIEQKLQQAQAVQEFKFRVDKEKLESDRKRVEAEGIRAFQETVTPAITDSYLKWRGIEATLQLSQSNNSKVVIIGSQGGLPVILNGADPAPAAPAAPAAPLPPVKK